MNRKKYKDYWKREWIRNVIRKINNHFAINLMAMLEQEILYGSREKNPIEQFASRTILTIGSSRGHIIQTPIHWNGVLHDELPTSGFNIVEIGNNDAGT